MEDLGCTPLLDGVRSILARSSGGAENPDLNGVVLRQVPVAQRVVPQEDIRGEVMDFIVQQIEDTRLSPSAIWAIASRVANKISETIPSSIQINALNTVAKQELDSLCVKVAADPSILEVPSSSSSISVNALRNTRRTMEDRHVIIPDLNLVAGLQASPQYEYYAVFDGHGGRDGANYCAAHLHLVLAEQLRSGIDARAAIEKAFKIVDGNFCDRAKEIARKAGSTAVVALIVDQKTLHVGWLGDSEAVLARGGSAQALVKPHKPSVISEQDRIERLGGGVVSVGGVHRVNGNLAVSRAVGDVEHKPYVSSEAELSTVQLDGFCDFVVLGCDGLFDSLTHQEVVVTAYHCALTRRFDTSVAENLTKAAILKGSNDNITTIVVNLRDPKKWHFESVVCPKSKATDRVASAGKQLNVSSETVASAVSLAGGEASPVREVAAGFVSGTVGMALSKVNGTPPSSLDVACDLSPPEEEQRDLMARLDNDTPEADRLNPDAPEFVPTFPLGSTASDLPPDQSSSDKKSQATVAADGDVGEMLKKFKQSVASKIRRKASAPATGMIPTSESRDELVYEIDREHGMAPQAGQAELVNLQAPAAVGVSPPRAVESLSDSDEDLNSMVVHEDQPQPEIKLSELIIREPHIHVIPEESPGEETPIPAASPKSPVSASDQPMPEIVPQTEPLPPTPPAAISQNGTSEAPPEDQQPPPTLVNSVVEAPQAATSVGERLVDLTPLASEDLVDLASQIVQPSVLDQIELGDSRKAAAVTPGLEYDSQYLFSGAGGVHEAAIVPRDQPLLFEQDPVQEAAQKTRIEAVDSVEDGPKIVDAIEKLSELTLEDSLAEVATGPRQAVPELRAEDSSVFGSGHIGLESVQDVVEKLSAQSEQREEAVSAPIIPDSIPEAEGVQDVDSESDNDAQEWSFVKPVEQSPAVAAAAAVAVATSAAAAVVAKTSPAPKATEKSKAPSKAVKGAPAGRPLAPARTPAVTPAKVTPAKASPKTAAAPAAAGTTPAKAAARTSTASPSGVRPAAPRASVVGSKAPGGAKLAPSAAAGGKTPLAAPRAATARAAAAKPAAPSVPKVTASAAKTAPAGRPVASKPAIPKPAAAAASGKLPAAPRPAVAARASVPSVASKAAPAKPAVPRPAAPKAPLKSTSTTAAAAAAAVKPSLASTTRTAASTVRAPVAKSTSASTAGKKPAPAAPAVAATRVAAARAAAGRPAGGPKAAPSTATSAKPKTAAVKTASTAGVAGKTAPKPSVKKAVRQESAENRKPDQNGPAAAAEEDSKENGSASAVSKMNGHASPQVKTSSAEPSGPAVTEAIPPNEGQGDILV